MCLRTTMVYTMPSYQLLAALPLPNRPNVSRRKKFPIFRRFSLILPPTVVGAASLVSASFCGGPGVAAGLGPPTGGLGDGLFDEKGIGVDNPSRATERIAFPRAEGSKRPGTVEDKAATLDMAAPVALVLPRVSEPRIGFDSIRSMAESL
jgi:hypothetical protein